MDRSNTEVYEFVKEILTTWLGKSKISALREQFTNYVRSWRSKLKLVKLYITYRSTLGKDNGDDEKTLR